MITPGPWIVKHAGSADEIWSDRGMVAELSLYAVGSQIAGANAKAIAAVPDMIEALKLFTQGYQTPNDFASEEIMSDAHHKACAALQKAGVE